MPFCPNCKYEYVPSITQCPDCDVALVDKLPEEKAPEAEWAELVCVGEYMSTIDAEMAKVRLHGEGITGVLFNEIVTRSYAATSMLGPGIRLMVNECDAQRARAILEQDNS